MVPMSWSFFLDGYLCSCPFFLFRGPIYFLQVTASSTCTACVSRAAWMRLRCDSAASRLHLFERFNVSTIFHTCRVFRTKNRQLKLSFRINPSKSQWNGFLLQSYYIQCVWWITSKSLLYWAAGGIYGHSRYFWSKPESTLRDTRHQLK